MPPRLTRKRRDEIKAEAQAWKREEHPMPETVLRVMACGHEDDVAPGIDPTKVKCARCIAASMTSGSEKSYTDV
jgi:hypothetical protein